MVAVMGAPACQQRARGLADIIVRRHGTQTRLADLRQQGCLRICFPRATGTALQAILLNTAGGVTDGDVLRTSLTAQAQTTMVVATQAAERIYRARRGADPARVSLRATIADGARLEYLPQETIFFNGCALDRNLHVDLAPASAFLGVETLVFGRAASGETIDDIQLRDTVRLRRDGRLIYYDSTLLRGPAALAAQAGAAGGGVVATLLYAAPDAASWLAPLRDVVAQSGGGASLRDGVLVARLVARDSQSARVAMVAALALLRGGQALPPVWCC